MPKAPAVQAQQNTDADGEGRVGAAVRNGLAAGFEQHLPITVGLLLRGGACCLLASFLHFVLGVDLGLSAIAGGLGATNPFFPPWGH